MLISDGRRMSLQRQQLFRVPSSSQLSSSQKFLRVRAPPLPHFTLISKASPSALTLPAAKEGERGTEGGAEEELIQPSSPSSFSVIAWREIGQRRGSSKESGRRNRQIRSFPFSGNAVVSIASPPFLPNPLRSATRDALRGGGGPPLPLTSTGPDAS